MAPRRRIAILTAGGDCPGLNAVIRAIVKASQNVHGWEVWGVRNGYEGFLIPGEDGIARIERGDIAGILPRGGTILGASNEVNLFSFARGKGRPRDESGRVARRLKEHGISALVVIGGEGTQAAAARLVEMGVPIVSVPKTIDNDLGGTDVTFGHDSAVAVVAEAIDRLHSTAESHHRVMCVEVMGRHAGWIALHAGLAGGANVILLPERHFDVEQVAGYVEKRFQHQYAPIVVVAEGAQPLDGQMQTANTELDAFGHVRLGGIGQWLADQIEARTGKEARTVVLGHIQRGGTPTAFDRVLATRFGLQAIDAVNDGDWGKMMALRGTDIVRVPLIEGTRELKTVPLERYTEAEVFFGS